jgi:nicotinamidase-related amidase
LQAAKANGDNIIFTRDTHTENYMETGEGKHLPVKHCVKDTEGWQVVPELMEETDENTLFIDKTHFGFDNWTEYVKEGDEVVICGTCTSICVSANVSALKMIEGVEVKVIADCCADINEEAHKAGLKVMEMQQCEIV